MAIRLINPAFGKAANTIISDLGYDVERRLIAAGMATHDLTGGDHATSRTFAVDMTEGQRQRAIVAEIDRHNYGQAFVHAFTFDALETPQTVPTKGFDLSGGLMIRARHGSQSCVMYAAVADRNGDVVLGQPTLAANCLPALVDDGAALYFVFQHGPTLAYKLSFAADGTTLTVQQEHGDTGEPITFTISAKG